MTWDYFLELLIVSVFIVPSVGLVYRASRYPPPIKSEDNVAPPLLKPESVEASVAQLLIESSEDTKEDYMVYDVFHYILYDLIEDLQFLILLVMIFA